MEEYDTGRAKISVLHSLSLRSHLTVSNTTSSLHLPSEKHYVRNLIEKLKVDHLQNRNSCLQAEIIKAERTGIIQPEKDTSR